MSKEHSSLPIASLGDTDTYQIFMGQIARTEFPDVRVKYEFINRKPDTTFFPSNFANQLEMLFQEMATVELSDAEANHLKENHPYVDPAHIDWFQHDFRFNPDHITELRVKDGNLKVEWEGPWHEDIYWETPAMATIVELYNRNTPNREPVPGWEENVMREAKKAKKAYEEFGWQYAEFGARRRYSYDVHDTTLGILKEFSGGALIGTSNPHFAEKYGIRSIGTWAHQMAMAMAAMYGYPAANGAVTEEWMKAYGPNLATSLTDTFTNEVFFDNVRGWQEYWDYIKVFRHDSGPEEEYMQLVRREIIQNGQNPKDKSLLFTDGLTMDKAIAVGRKAVKEYGFKSAHAGIGTFLTHNQTGVPGIDIVIKPTEFYVPDKGWVPVAKLSAVAGKKSGPGADEAIRQLGLRIQGTGREARFIRD